MISSFPGRGKGLPEKKIELNDVFGLNQQTKIKLTNKDTDEKYDVSAAGIYVNQNYYDGINDKEADRGANVNEKREKLFKIDTAGNQLVQNLQQQVYFLELELEHLRVN